VVEGFGNAFLEAIYFRKPIVVNNYSVYATDIKPKGFEAIEFDEYVTEETVAQTHLVLDNADLARRMCDKNYELAAHHFSYEMLQSKLRVQLANVFGTNDI
jgi:mannosylglucosylglycerate synthase